MKITETVLNFGTKIIKITETVPKFGKSCVCVVSVHCSAESADCSPQFSKQQRKRSCFFTNI